MCFKLSKKQIIILIIFSLVGGLLARILSAFMSGPLLYVGETTTKYYLPYFFGILIFGILTYLIEVIYNYFSDWK